MMSAKQKMELTWTTDETPPFRWPRVRLEFAEDPARADAPVISREATLSVCGFPRCGCMNIRFQWLPAPPAAAPPLPFLLDLNTKVIVPSPELPVNAESRRLAEIIGAELTEADQNQLRGWYLARKLHIIESTPPEQIDLSDLPDATGGLMIGFVDVFPCGLALNFNLNEEAWVVDDQYCVEPGCNCGETVLNFLKIRDAAGNLNTGLKDPPALYYHRGTGVTRTLTSGAAGNPAPEALLAAVKDANPDFDTQLQLRHLIMQSLYLRQDHQRRRTRAALLAPDSDTAGPAVSRKIGRNEPCPCGSGRKYKRCCLNKPPANRDLWEG